MTPIDCSLLCVSFETWKLIFSLVSLCFLSAVYILYFFFTALFHQKKICRLQFATSKVHFLTPCVYNCMIVFVCVLLLNT